METGTALARAMMRVMKNPHYRVDIINMSYGEHAHWSDSGCVSEADNFASGEAVTGLTLQSFYLFRVDVVGIIKHRKVC